MLLEGSSNVYKNKIHTHVTCQVPPFLPGKPATDLFADLCSLLHSRGQRMMLTATFRAGIIWRWSLSSPSLRVVRYWKPLTGCRAEKDILLLMLEVVPSVIRRNTSVRTSLFQLEVWALGLKRSSLKLKRRHLAWFYELKVMLGRKCEQSNQLAISYLPPLIGYKRRCGILLSMEWIYYIVRRHSRRSSNLIGPKFGNLAIWLVENLRWKACKLIGRELGKLATRLVDQQQPMVHHDDDAWSFRV